jgi:hypothetical protein
MIVAAAGWAVAVTMSASVQIGCEYETGYADICEECFLLF